MEEIFRTDVAREQITVVEDMLERSDLERIIVVAGRSPADVTFQVRLAEVREIEDLLFDVCEEVPVSLFATDFECSPDVLEEVDVAELGSECHASGSRCRR